MPQAKFTSAYTGQQVESAIKKALPLESFPTTTNQVGGFTVHPETGRICEVYSNQKVVSLNRYMTEDDYISTTDIDALFL